MTRPASRAATAEALAPQAAEAVATQNWSAFEALLTGPLDPPLMQPVLRILRSDKDLDPGVLSDLSRTLVRRLDVEAVAAVSDLRMWHEAPAELRAARERAWTELRAGRLGDRRAALAAPSAWGELVVAEGFEALPRQARVVGLIEAAQAHWRAGRRGGSVANLQQGVAMAQRAARVAAELPHAAEALTLAGDAGLDLWRFAPLVGDLEAAIADGREALARTSSGHPRHGWRAARVAGKLITLSLHQGTIVPLSEALALLQDAPEATADPEDRCGVLHDLSRAAGRRWEIARDPDDLELSVLAARRAVREVPPESADVRIMRSGLATALRRRGEATASIDDMQEVLRIRRELVALETDDPRRAIVRSNLARSLRDVGEITGQAKLIDEAIETLVEIVAATDPDSDDFARRLHDLARCYRARAADGDADRTRETLERAIRAAADHPEVRAVVANDLGTALTTTCDRAGAARAFDAALDALYELQSREDHLADRLTQLGRVQNVPANAASAALDASGADAALRTADKGRAVVLSELLARAPAIGGDELRTGVLCIGSGDAGGFAIISTADGPVTARYPELTSTAVAARVQDLSERIERRHQEPDLASRAIEEIAQWLGEVLGLERLGLPKQTTVVALGPLALLPVHLAHHDGVPLCLRREVTFGLRVSSWRRIPSPRANEWLSGLAVVPISDRLPPLLFAGQESQALRDAVARCTTLEGTGAARASVLAALPEADVAHFAGHARSIPDHPLGSSFMLSDDEPLTVGDLLSAPRAARLNLLVLSGCETAMPGRRVPDESISLAAAAVVAGADCVLSTLWPVSQVAAALMCRGFYARWRESPERPAAALSETQRWMREASVDELAGECEAIGAPITDPAQLTDWLHWAGWTITTV